MKNLSDFHYNPDNPRIIRDKPYKELKKSLEKAPWMMKLRPIVVDETGMILAGDKRHRILVELKYKEVVDEWIIQAEDLTEEQKKEFIIKDNLHSGEWDWAILNQNWDAAQLKEWSLQVPEWDLSDAGGGDGDDEEKSGGKGGHTARTSPGDGFAIFEMILQADQKQKWERVLSTLQNRLSLEKQSDAFMIVLDTFLEHHPIGGDASGWDDPGPIAAAAVQESEAQPDQDDEDLPDDLGDEDEDLEDADEEDDQDEEQEKPDQPQASKKKAAKPAKRSQHVVKSQPKKKGRPAKSTAVA